MTKEEFNILEKYYEENKPVGRYVMSRETGLSIKKCRNFLTKIKNNEIIEESKVVKQKKQLNESKKKYNKSINIISSLNDKIDEILEIKNSNILRDIIKIKSKTNKSESVPVILFSDWHIEKTVESSSVHYVNFYNLDEAKRSIKEIFINSVFMINKEAYHTHISQCVYAMLGDLIDGYIHDENMLVNSLTPIESSVELLAMLEDGFRYVLDNTDIDIFVPCVIGNHSRTTKKIMHTVGYKTNYEYLVYCLLADRFKNNKRIVFDIPQCSETIVNVFDYRIRMYHGFNIRYSGGIGGITIPLNKAIARANTCEPVDLDCLGHYHTFQTANNFIVNGSVIGYDGYAMSNKFPFEKPSQTFFLMDKEHGRTITTPLFINRKKIK